MLEVSVLASGSSGNCFYIGSEDSSILIDAGISCKQIKDRLDKLGKDIEKVKGVFITHEHCDHVRGIEVLSRKYNLPVFVNRGTLTNSYKDMGNIRLIEKNKTINFEGFIIYPFAKSHDASEPISFLVEKNKKKVGILTDIGFCCQNVKKTVSNSDLLILESNHDLNMLSTGPYPYLLKKRIASSVGHLSNYEAALAVLENGNKKLQHVLLAHLSENNNTPELAMQTFCSVVQERCDLSRLKTGLTYREKPTDLIRI